MKIQPTQTVLKSAAYDPDLLARILDGAVQLPAGAEVKVGTIDDFDALLAAAGFSEADNRLLVRQTVDLVGSVHGHPEMDHAVEELRASVSRGDLFLYIAGKDQPFRDPSVQASNSVAAANFEALSSEEFARLKSSGKAAAPGLLTGMNVLIHRRQELPTRIEVASWLSNFFHEAAHYAALKLLSQWVAANSASEKPDEVFARNVRVRDGKFVLDKTFYKTFVEGRAYSVSGFVAGHLLPREMHGMLSGSVWERALADVREELGERAIAEIGLTSSNFADYSRAVSELLLATIAKRAGA